MLLVTAQTRILVCVKPFDFCNGIDGLSCSRSITSGSGVRNLR